MDRNEILANFQACTGIDDISECIAHLEQHDWNLNDAVQVALAADLESPPRSLNIPAVQAMFPQYQPLPHPRPSAAKERMIEFIINMGTVTKHIVLDDTTNISTLRRLAALEFEIPETETHFEGWPGGGSVYLPGETELSTLQLPSRLNLEIPMHQRNGATVGPSELGAFHSEFGACSSDFGASFQDDQASKDSEKLRQNYIVEVTDKRTKKVFNLTMPGSKTFEELRFDAHSLTDIPPSKQIWEGLSSDLSRLSNDQTIGSLDLRLPVHKCSITDDEPGVANDNESDDVMEIDEFGDATAEFLYAHNTPTTSSRQLPLMPNEATEEVAALAQFQAEFNNRYGQDAPITPSFFLGSLDDAIQEAFGGPARKRKILAVYLHHDQSIQSNVFCSQLLCAPSIVEYTANHCVIWAWDVTSDFNKQKLLDMCTKHFGSAVAATVRRIPRDGFPMLVLAQGRGRSCEVNTIIQGNTSLDELTVQLIKAVDDADVQKEEDVRMEAESEERELIKREQEKAYEESLKQDKEKQERLEAEKAELERKQREEERLQKEKKEKIEQLTQIVPPEPDPECGEPISKIRFRPPCGGEVISRTFLASEKLQGLLNFVGSLGYLSDKYRVITSYPKRDISSLDAHLTLKDHKLFPQDTLIIEEMTE